MIRGAVLSDDGLYRYSLTRKWGDGGRVLWIMLNPSTANATVDDATIRRCIGFSRAWGFASMEVANLYALRAREPALVRRHHDPVGPDNDGRLRRAARRAGMVIAAWGAFVWAAPRIREVEQILDAPCLCLGCTRGGFPKHPLYVPRATPLVAYQAVLTRAGAIRRTRGACRAPATRS